MKRSAPNPVLVRCQRKTRPSAVSDPRRELDFPVEALDCYRSRTVESVSRVAYFFAGFCGRLRPPS